MTCDVCGRKFNYCFYINDEHWLKAVGGKEGHRCAHCVLEKLGGSDWYVIWNEPAARIRQAECEVKAEPNKCSNDYGYCEAHGHH